MAPDELGARTPSLLRARHPMRWATLLGLGLVIASPGCSRNPATGRLQFALISESEEIELGRRTDAELRKQIGVYDEAPRVNAMVQDIGTKIAAASERPTLPWAFQVLDDPGVNAFAVPGGFVYVTRGLLGHLNSRDELAAVLGHEAAHVTARHGAVQLRKQQSARRSINIFRVIDPNLRHIGGIVAGSAGLALLKHSRDDENEADALSLRYVSRTGYDLAAIVEVFGVLSSVSAASGAQVPSYLSTHPEPQARKQAMTVAIGEAAKRRPAIDPEYLRTIDGLLHGEDPREGYLVGDRFVHPRAGIRLDLPHGWKARFEGLHVLALSSDEKAIFAAAPSEHRSAREAMAAFFSDGEAAQGTVWEGEVGGFAMISAPFAITSSDGNVAGLLAFAQIEDGKVLAMLAMGPAAGWEQRTDAIARTFASLHRLVEPVLRDIAPMRIRVVQLQQPMSLEELQRVAPSAVSTEELGRLNHVAPATELPAGYLVKRVEGINPQTLR